MLDSELANELDLVRLFDLHATRRTHLIEEGAATSEEPSLSVIQFRTVWAQVTGEKKGNLFREMQIFNQYVRCVALIFNPTRESSK